VAVNTSSLLFDDATRGIHSSTGFLNFSGYETGSNWTLSLWVKPRQPQRALADYGAQYTFSSIVTHHAQLSSQRRAVNMNLSNRNVEFGNSTWVAGTIYLNPASTDAVANLSIDQWSHVAVTFTSAAVTVYVNGQASTPVDWSTQPTFTQIDYMSNDNGNRHHGHMDQIAVFKHVLTASDVLTLYNAGTPPDLTSLSPDLWFPCNEGSGDVITNYGSDATVTTVPTNGVQFSSDVP
jgi:hypothetical protein